MTRRRNERQLKEPFSSLRGATRDLPAATTFLAPSLLVFGVFIFLPLFFSAYLSLTAWDLVSPVRDWVWFGNYFRLAQDPLFWRVLQNTTVFSGVVVFFSMAFGLLLAQILNRPLKGRTLYRAGIFLPYVTSTAAMALVWLWILDPQYGLINALLRVVGLEGPGWLASVEWALPALMLMTVWRFTGYDMLLFLGGLQNISGELIEAARLDGANDWDLFWKITLPLLSPTTFFIAVTSFITMFQNFETVYVMTKGGPVNSTNMLVYYLYQNAFQFFEAGYASSIAMILFIMIISLTALQVRLSGRWVHY